MKTFALIIPALVFAACAPVTQEPPNLSDLKKEVSEYADSGAYQRDLAASVSSAESYLAARKAKGGKNLTVVFDIDETVLSNLPLMKHSDWGYQPPQWDRWIGTADAPALQPIRRIYKAALENDYRVIFLSGRREAQRRATARNLLSQRMDGYNQLILRPDTGWGKSATAVDFKSSVRKRLTAQGYTIVASFGDQDSDLAGGCAGRTYKLPNPFYRIP